MSDEEFKKLIYNCYMTMQKKNKAESRIWTEDLLIACVFQYKWDAHPTVLIRQNNKRHQ